MKGLLYILLIILMIEVSACRNKGKSKETVISFDASSMIDSTLKKTTIKFDEVEKDFGEIKEGEILTLAYVVSNTGKADLFLQKVTPSCGCTTPKYDQKPIRPGKKGEIEVTFNTKGRPGKQRKTVMVTTNTEPPNTVLTFTCEVIPNKE